MRRVLTLGAGVLIGQWLAFGTMPAPADFHAVGMHAFERRDYAEAARVWSRAVAAQPDNPLFHYLRGTALAHLGHRASAADAYQLTLLLEPPQQIASLARAGLVGLNAGTDAGDGSVVTVPLEAMRGVWVATVLVNDVHPARFLVDSGSSVTLVSPALAATLGLEGTRPSIELQTLGGRTAGPPSTVKSLRLGAAELRDAPVVVHEPGPDLDGILGNNFLGRYLVTLDASRGLLHLRASARN